MQLVVKIVIIISLLFALGCKKNNPEPVPPVITFVEANLSIDKTYTLVKFEFFDGDGDLGLKQEENSGSQEFNLFVDYYEKINGAWVLKSPVVTWNTNENKFDTTELHLRVPFIENKENTSLRGETLVKLFYDFNADTLRYDLTLVDRAFHKSNIITTTEIIIN